MRSEFRWKRVVVATTVVLSLVAQSRGTDGSNASFNLAATADGRTAVETALKADDSGKHTCAEQLVMVGRSNAASGNFAVSAAAHLMFLEEFAPAHPHSAHVAAQLADSLAPLDLQAVDVFHMPDGPRYEPAWRMNAEPTTEELRQAIVACDYAASLASEPQARGAMLLKAGWIQRALGDWPASTVAFERCAAEASGTSAAREALRLASENQRWTEHVAEAAELLRRMQRDAADEAAHSLAEEIGALDAEALRDGRWLADPVAGVQAEIEKRRNDRSPEEVFREAMNWLAQRGDQPAQLTLARWGMAQAGWSPEGQLAAHLHAADALLANPSPDAKAEAAEVLGQLIEIAPNDNWLVSTAMRRSALLREIDSADQAAAMWEEVAARMQKPQAWSAQVLPERIKAAQAAGDRAAAERLFEELEQNHPEHTELGALRAMLGINEVGK